MSEREEQQSEYADVYRWQCLTCGMISGQWCARGNSLDDAPHCCAGVRMIKVRVRVKKEEPRP